MSSGPNDDALVEGPDEGFQPFEVRVVLPSGKAFVAEYARTTTCMVSDLRQRVGDAWAVHQEQVILMHSSTSLRDDQPLADILIPDEGSENIVTVSAVLRPCRIQPSDYAAYVKVFPWQPGRGLSFNPRGFIRVGWIDFPPPKDRNINMMPFRIGDPLSLPEEYRDYWPWVERCGYLDLERGRIGFLTIQESLVAAGTSQRRPGAHTEAHGFMVNGGEMRFPFGWGAGDMDEVTYRGGIYMASSVSHSCRIWNAKIKSPELSLGKHGDVEHLRDFFGWYDLLEAGELVWLTDVTPHESLPLPEDTYRQFFRVVTSGLSVWFDSHSTKNPLGITPDPSVTKIVYGNKFADG